MSDDNPAELTGNGYSPFLPNLGGLQRAARDLDDYRLAEQLAVAVARRDAAAAHGYHGIAATWQEAAEALAQVRDERRRTRAEFTDVVSSVHVRPLTAEELADVAWPDEAP
jgi:hypothetical protein